MTERWVFVMLPRDEAAELVERLESDRAVSRLTGVALTGEMLLSQRRGERALARLTAAIDAADETDP